MVIPDSCRSNFRPFYLHPPHALLDPRSLLSPQARSRSCRSPFPGRLPFWASPFASRLANASGRIEFIIFLIMDWSFASGCSPPRLSATQFPSATDSQCSVRWGLPPHCWCALSGALAFGESADRAQTASEIHRMPSPGLKGVTCYGPSTNSSMACAKPSSSFL